MYEKLGDLLKEAIDNNSFPKAEDNNQASQKKEEKLPEENIEKNTFPKLPDKIKKSLDFLKLPYDSDSEKIKKRYRELLHKYHPDSLETKAEDSSIALKLRHLQTEKLTEVYNQLKSFYKF